MGFRWTPVVIAALVLVWGYFWLLLRDVEQDPSFSSKQAYSKRLAASEYKTDGDLQRQFILDGYEIRYLNLIIRHTERNPTQKTVSKLRTLYDKLASKDDLRKNDFVDSFKEYLDEWSLHTAELTDIGNRTAYAMGARMNENFKNFIVNSENMKYTSTCAVRTLQTLENFVKGVFQKKEQLVFLDDWHKTSGHEERCAANEPDLQFRFYKLCPKYVNFKKSIYRPTSYFLLLQSSGIKQATKKVNKKLKLNLTLDETDVGLLYDACAFYHLTNFTHSKNNYSICSIFDEQDIKAFTAHKNIEMLFKSGPTLDITSNISCPYFQSLYKNLNEAVNNNKRVNSSINFVHAETVLPILSQFGILDKYLNDHASFDAARYVPMGANLAIVLLFKDNKHYVLVLLNERPILLPCCAKSAKGSLCLFKDFKNCFQDHQVNCQFEKFCAIHD